MCYPVSVNCNRKPIEFCSNSKDYVVLASTVIKVWWSKDKKLAFLHSHIYS